VTSSVLPFRLDLTAEQLTDAEIATLNALEKKAAATALGSLASLAKINELDHLGGGLELIPSLLMTLGIVDYEAKHYTIEHAHTSIGYYGALSALGFIDSQVVVDEFRRGVDIAGHVAWLPGGTPMNGGRLGVMVPVAVGQALAAKSYHGEEAFTICHCGDAAWISGQALNGFNGADVHGAPICFVMHRNGIQLSGSCASVMDKDPRPVVAAMGIEVIEISSLHDKQALFGAYKRAHALAKQGRPSMIYPTGFECSLTELGETYGISAVVDAFAGRHGVAMDTRVQVPGSLMSWRDVVPMLECIFLVNNLPGGEGHHDGHMKGRDLAEVLANPMFMDVEAETEALSRLSDAPTRTVVTRKRPAPGSANLVIDPQVRAGVELPAVGACTSARSGSQEGYALVAKTFPARFFNVSCDLDPSTKLAKAAGFIPAKNNFQMSIEEQVSALMANGIAMADDAPHAVVFATFAAFFEGIAREGLEMWRYTRNLNGINEGLNAIMHLSHVGACTGRDHFSGWSLDWITLAMGYLPYLDRFYTPADARGAFLATYDACARYGASIVGIPRDNLPVLAKADGSALYNPEDEWTPTSVLKESPGATKAILAMGATAMLAQEAAAEDSNTDVIVVNGLPFGEGELAGLIGKYSGGLVTVEDGIIGHAGVGLRGFASLVHSQGAGKVPLAHVGITDPTVAPSEGHMEVWEHFGLTATAVKEAVAQL
jgi:transketolase N-terminal domain/subunit/transketolase C-terminal domain/subunit